MKSSKSILFVLVCLIQSSFSYATIRTVSNTPNTTIAQFSTIQAAINASVSGDSVYVHGSQLDYAGFTLDNKRLTILGPGWSPLKQLPFTAKVGNTIIKGLSSKRSEIQGIIFTGTFAVNQDNPDSLQLLRNIFMGGMNFFLHGVTYKGYVFEGNVFSNMEITVSPYSIHLNWIFRNNIFYRNGGNSINNFTHMSSTVLFDHNLWYGPSSGIVNCFGGNTTANSGFSEHLVFTNNIFVRRNVATNGNFNSFSHNITFNTGTDFPWTVNGNMDDGGNIGAMDPQMVDQSTVNGGTNNPLANFMITGGPANDSGIGGVDMGLLFQTSGSLNWTNSRNSRLPRIFSMSITNPTIEVNGTLNLNVEARKSN